MKNFDVDKFKQNLEDSDIQFEVVEEGGIVVIIIILPRSRQKIKCFTNTGQFQFTNSISEKLELDNLLAISRDIRAIEEVVNYL